MQAPTTIRNQFGERLDHVFTPGREGGRDLVVIGHGVTSHHDRPYFAELCAGFARAATASLRFSFAGNGNSEGRFEDCTITKEVGDLGSVLDSFDGWNVTYVGHSMGGAVGMLRASMDERLAALVSLAGMVQVQAFMERVFGHLEPDREDMLDREGCPLTRTFLDDAKRIGTVLPQAAALELPFLIVHGSADELVPIEESYELHAANATSELAVLEGVDHRFTDHLDELVRTVVSWTTAQLSSPRKS